jgi:hypothetical protein
LGAKIAASAAAAAAARPAETAGAPEAFAVIGPMHDVITKLPLVDADDWQVI